MWLIGTVTYKCAANGDNVVLSLGLEGSRRGKLMTSLLVSTDDNLVWPTSIALFKYELHISLKSCSCSG